MQKIGKIGFIGFIFILGLIAGSFIVRSPKLALAPEANVKFQAILDHEYTDYLRLKNLEERYSKADEILGKIMNIFLADLQLHFIKPADAVVASTSTPTPAENSTPNSVSIKPTSTLASSASTPVQKKIDEVINLDKLGDPGSINRFLMSQKKDDLRPIWITGSPIKNLPQNLNGCFEGQARIEKTDEVWFVGMFYQIDMGNKGVAMFTMAKDGRIFTRSRSRGELNAVRGIPADPNGILLEADPNTTIFQMYFLPTPDLWVANIYSKQKDDSMKYIGKVSLHRGTGCEHP